MKGKGNPFVGNKPVVTAMMNEGGRLLAEEKIEEERMKFFLGLDCRYVKQYHEVSVPVSAKAVRAAHLTAIKKTFHAEHNRLYGYSLEEEGTPVELINVRLRAVGITEKPPHIEEPRGEEDPQEALKGERSIHIPEDHGILGDDAHRIPVFQTYFQQLPGDPEFPFGRLIAIRVSR